MEVWIVQVTIQIGLRKLRVLDYVFGLVPNQGSGKSKNTASACKSATPEKPPSSSAYLPHTSRQATVINDPTPV